MRDSRRKGGVGAQKIKSKVKKGRVCCEKIDVGAGMPEYFP